jgi:hypothetical protein
MVNQHEVRNTGMSDLQQIFELFEHSIAIRKRMAIRFGEIMIRIRSSETLKIKTNIK